MIVLAARLVDPADVGAWGYAATLAAVGMLPVLVYALVHGWRSRRR